VPTNDGFRSDNSQGAQHIWSQAIEPGEDHPVEGRPLRRLAPPQDIKLVAKRQNLDFQ
jgi:hypothetical protein